MRSSSKPARPLLQQCDESVARSLPSAIAASIADPHADNLCSTDLLRVGCIIGAHGVRGALRIRMDNPDSDVLRHLRKLTLAHHGSELQYAIVAVQSAGRGTLKIALDGVSGFAAAENLGGATVMVNVADLPAPAAGEFYYFQAIGCEVVTTQGASIGFIEEVFSNGAHDVWVVRNGSAEWLVPVIEDIVKKTNWAARQVTIEAIPGLLE